MRHYQPFLVWRKRVTVWCDIQGCRGCWWMWSLILWNCWMYYPAYEFLACEDCIMCSFEIGTNSVFLDHGSVGCRDDSPSGLMQGRWYKAWNNARVACLKCKSLNSCWSLVQSLHQELYIHIRDTHTISWHTLHLHHLTPVPSYLIHVLTLHYFSILPTLHSHLSFTSHLT